MSDFPTIFQVKPEQVGSTDINQFLLSAIAREFGDNYSIVTEQTTDRIVPYVKGLRKIKSYAVEARGVTHSLFFDITEVSSANAINWGGR
jgi:hypothetical protein